MKNRNSLQKISEPIIGFWDTLPVQTKSFIYQHIAKILEKPDDYAGTSISGFATFYRDTIKSLRTTPNIENAIRREILDSILSRSRILPHIAQEQAKEDEQFESIRKRYSTGNAYTDQQYIEDDIRNESERCLKNILFLVHLLQKRGNSLQDIFHLCQISQITRDPHIFLHLYDEDPLKYVFFHTIEILQRIKLQNSEFGEGKKPGNTFGDFERVSDIFSKVGDFLSSSKKEDLQNVIEMIKNGSFLKSFSQLVQELLDSGIPHSDLAHMYKHPHTIKSKSLSQYQVQKLEKLHTMRHGLDRYLQWNGFESAREVVIEIQKIFSK